MALLTGTDQRNVGNEARIHLLELHVLEEVHSLGQRATLPRALPSDTGLGRHFHATLRQLPPPL